MAGPTKPIPSGATTTTTADFKHKRNDAIRKRRSIRVSSLDGLRGLLALHIVFGHFVRFAGPPNTVLRFFAQVNVTVGAFFALSGYVAAYTCTRVGETGTSPKFDALSRKQWWLSRAMTFCPMHWFVLFLFGPVFVYADVSAAASGAQGFGRAMANGLLSATLTQAWFPTTHAEIWNAPTWFLSSLLVCNAIIAVSLPPIASADKRGLRILLAGLYGINIVPVLVYLMCIGKGLGPVEGMTKPKELPAYALFNVLRFFPVFNGAETLMGAVACRIVMLDDGTNGKDNAVVVTNATTNRVIGSAATAIPFGIAIGVLIGRSIDLIPDCSDLLVRKVVFVPVFLNLVMASHRNAVTLSSNNNARGRDSVSGFLSTKQLLWLGNLSFPIYILHGPIGQVFYKRAIATKLWGGVPKGAGFFALYVATVVLSAILVRGTFLKDQKEGVVGSLSKRVVAWFGD